MDYLYVMQWKAILSILKNPADAEAVSRLRAVRAEALQKQYWESVRDCDRFEATSQGNESLMQQVYFGTPFPSFRRRLLEDFARSTVLPSEYMWRLKSEAGTGPVFDFLVAEGDTPRQKLRAGLLMHRLLIVLSKDFYKPVRVAVLHHELHPEEFYNPVTSPPRVYEVVRRLREWFARRKLPLDIEQKSGFYALVATAPVSIRLRQSAMLGKRSESYLFKLKERFPQQPFSAIDVSRVLGYRRARPCVSSMSH